MVETEERFIHLKMLICCSQPMECVDCPYLNDCLKIAKKKLKPGQELLLG
jgi:hypothetical protein